MSGATVPVICVCCDTPGLHVGRGLIDACHGRHTRAGTLDRFPPVRKWLAEWRATRVIANIPPPAIDLPEPRWKGAACVDHDPELFFPISESNLAQVEQAKAVCNACPLLDDCDTWVRDNPQGHGIWAALTSTERRLQRTRAHERNTA